MARINADRPDRDRAADRIGRDRDRDARARARLDVDAVVADPEAGDDLQTRGIRDRLGGDPWCEQQHGVVLVGHCRRDDIAGVGQELPCAVGVVIEHRQADVPPADLALVVEEVGADPDLEWHVPPGAWVVGSRRRAHADTSASKRSKQRTTLGS